MKFKLAMVFSAVWIVFALILSISLIKYNPESEPAPSLPINMEVHVSDNVLLAEFVHSGAIMELSIECKYKDAGICKESLKHVKSWHEDIKKFCGDIPIVLFANKVDLIDENKLDDAEIQSSMKKNEFIGVFLTSAKSIFSSISSNKIIPSANNLYSKASY